jgi:hypothetical protein
MFLLSFLLDKREEGNQETEPKEKPRKKLSMMIVMNKNTRQERKDRKHFGIRRRTYIFHHQTSGANLSNASYRLMFCQRKRKREKDDFSFPFVS